MLRTLANLKKILLVLFVGTTLSAQALADEIVVYSSRKAHLIEPLFEAFTKETGTPVKFVTDKAGPLIARLEAEGKKTPADLFITVDAGNLWQATQKGLLMPVKRDALTQNVPASLRDPDGHWYGLSKRARTIVYHTGRVKTDDLSTYENLADSAWKGRLCLRTSKKVYNQSLVGMMIENLGEKETQNIVEGWVKNLVTKPFSNDTKVMKAILAGQCDVGIVNSYYYGRLVKKDPTLKIKLFWPNQNDRGVHVNISGAGVLKHAGNPEGAKALLTFLSSEKAQGLFASLNMEYPVNPSVEMDDVVKAFGTFKSDKTPIHHAGRLQASAVKLMDRAGYL